LFDAWVFIVLFLAALLQISYWTGNTDFDGRKHTQLALLSSICPRLTWNYRRYKNVGLCITSYIVLKAIGEHYDDLWLNISAIEGKLTHPTVISSTLALFGLYKWYDDIKAKVLTVYNATGTPRSRVSNAARSAYVFVGRVGRSIGGFLNKFNPAKASELEQKLNEAETERRTAASSYQQQKESDDKDKHDQARIILAREVISRMQTKCWRKTRSEKEQLQEELQKLKEEMRELESKYADSVSGGQYDRTRALLGQAYKDIESLGETVKHWKTEAQDAQNANIKLASTNKTLIAQN
ncbi:hypothetical protein LTS18_007163, partial [Coniosporium uncinatum]